MTYKELKELLDKIPKGKEESEVKIFDSDENEWEVWDVFFSRKRNEVIISTY